MRPLKTAATAATAALVLLLGLPVAPASALSPWWQLTSAARPGLLPSKPGETGEIALSAENLGDGVLDTQATSPVVLSDVLPEGLEATAIAGSSPIGHGSPNNFLPLKCSLAKISCEFEGSLFPYDALEVRVAVKVKAGAHSGESNSVAATGGGSPAATLARPLTFGEGPTPFGVEDFRTRFEEEGGTLDTRPGSHPFQMTTTVAINQGPDRMPVENVEHKPSVQPAGLARDVLTKFPAGFVGDPVPVPTCSLGQFLAIQVGGGAGKNPEDNACPQQSAVGVASVTIFEPSFLTYSTFTVPLFAVESYFGEPARFGFSIPLGNVPVLLDAAVRSNAGEGAIPGVSEDYGLNVDSNQISQTAGLISARVTVWGTPNDPRHNNSHGWGCMFETRSTQHSPCSQTSEAKPPAFLTTPTTCNAPLQASVEVDSWAQPGLFTDTLPSEPMPTLQGCNRLPFAPNVSASPTTHSASSATGLDVNVDFHDEGLLSPEGQSESRLKTTVVTLPEGFTINPSAGVGLVGCTPADFARETLASTPGAGCPNESKLGTVEIQTPVLKQAIQGSLYIAQPFENPFDSLVALYVVAKNPETGVLIKLAGKVTPNPVTGQLVTSFENTPQLPFNHFNFHFREGSQAPLISPPTCGLYTTTAQLTPWSEPLAPVNVSSSFDVTAGVGGGPCPAGAPPFNPGISSGTVNNNAGGFSAFDLRLTRGDGDQEISSFSTSLPNGLAAILTGIPYCPEPDIALARTMTGRAEEASPSCPAASKVGHSLVGTGVGTVLAYTPGQLYLAGPYGGDPFSLLSVTSAVVGPFDLGTVVLRFGLRIDPRTAKVSVDPAASEPIPRIIDGIVTHVRDIRVYVDRPNFTFNPTSCASMAISSTLGSDLGASATVSSPFQAASCANLKFEPRLTVTTPGVASKLNGAALTFKIAYPKDSIGKQAWFNEAVFDIPKELPARLSTIQQACIAATFESKRSACPAHSIIGHAVVHTPVLPVPLEGPVYFVSYGGAAFPDAVLVLHGDGVTIELHGNTFINGKTGVTSATFKALPDVPFESIEVNLPSGQYSEFGANLPHERYDFCGRKLVMPSLLKASNGLQLKKNTAVTITGCASTLTRSQKLNAALKACHKKRGEKRTSCERAARRRYSAKKGSGHKTTAKHNKSTKTKEP